MSKLDMQSFREQIVDLRAGVVNEIYFIDTKPNFIYVTNLGAAELYVDDQPNVTSSSYEVLAGTLMKRSLVKPLGIQKLYIYTEAEGKVKVESGIAELSLADIPMTQIVATLSNSLSISKVDVEKIIQALPAGNNNIGNVDIASMPDVNIAALPALPAGNNNIGDVDVVGWSSMITLLTDIKTELITQTALLNDIKTNTTPV